ncbi:MAG: hypothetical protein GY795_25335 [Desulfobacterales bacterium]|nr:hypothetical protein [Desulfobacterales bacterium]
MNNIHKAKNNKYGNMPINFRKLEFIYCSFRLEVHSQKVGRLDEKHFKALTGRIDTAQGNALGQWYH